MLRVARRLCQGREDDAQDIVQETLLRGYEAFIDGRFDESTNARAWLLCILNNIFLNEARRRKRQVDADVETLIDQGAEHPGSRQFASSEQPEQALMQQALDEPLAIAMASLTPDLRLCVVLVDMEGLEYAEVAKALQIPVGTVRSRLSRARIQLYNHLTGKEIKKKEKRFERKPWD